MTLPGSLTHHPLDERQKLNGRTYNACPFSFAGCDFQSHLTDAVRKHIKEEATKHLAFLCDAVQDFSGDVKQLRMNYEANESKTDSIEKRLIRMANVAGSHFLWKIETYNTHYNMAKSGAKVTIFSPPFLIGRHGYKMLMIAALYGDGKARGRYMSLFVSLVRGEYDAILPWPFHHKITLSLMDQCEDPELRKDQHFVIRPNPRTENKCFLGRPENDRNASFGAQNFVDLETVAKFSYVKNDTMFLRLVVDTSDMNVM